MITTRLRVLLVEDNPADADLLVRCLRRAGFDIDHDCVQTPAGLRAALAGGVWDIVISDHSLPAFDAPAALELVRDAEPDLPFIIVSGAIDDEIAVRAMRAGAADYVMKDNLARLPAAVERELRESVTRRGARLADEQRRAAEARVAAIVDAAADAILTIDDGGTIEGVNPAATRMFGWSEADLVGQNVQLLMPELYKDEHDGYIARSVETGERRVIGIGRQVEGRRRDGTTFPLDIGVSEVAVAERRLFVGIARDLTERQTLQHRLEYLARHDGTSGLLNRRAFIEQVRRLLAREEDELAVLELALDRFGLVDESLGRDAAETLVAYAAGRLTAVAGADDVLARVDERTLAVAVPGRALDGDAVARRFVSALSEPVELAGTRVFPAVTVGVAVDGKDSPDPEDIVRCAHAALLWAQEAGSGQIVVYGPQLEGRALARLGTESGLRVALADGQLWLAYQPEIDLATGRVAGFEALLRWAHPEHGTVPPAWFLPVAEETGLTVPIGRWALHEALRQVAEWRTVDPRLWVAVNLSSRQLHDPELLHEVEKGLEVAAVSGDALHLEITENVLMHDASASVAVLDGLRELGVRLDIDDFGTGYSSLAYLGSLPVDALKIDRSFIAALGTAEERGAIVAAVTALAQTLHMHAVAEGVETVSQLHALQVLGCDFAQGFHFSRPVPPAEAEEFVGRVLV